MHAIIRSFFKLTLLPALLLLCSCDNPCRSTAVKKYEEKENEMSHVSHVSTMIPITTNSPAEVRITVDTNANVAQQPTNNIKLDPTNSSLPNTLDQEIHPTDEAVLEQKITVANNSDNTTTIQVPSAAIAQYNGTTFFTATNLPKKLAPVNESTFIPLDKLEQDEIKTWYANQGYNPTTQALVTAVINRIDDDEKKEEKLSSNTKTSQMPKCVIFDIDETLVHSYESKIKLTQNKDRIEQNGKLNSQLFNQITGNTFNRYWAGWCLYNYFTQKGYTVFFISSRPEGYRQETVKRLKAFGYDCKQECLILKTMQYKQTKTAQFKVYIRRLIANQFQIIATIDDDYRNLLGDCVGNYAIWMPTPIYTYPDEDRFFNEVFNKEQRCFATMTSTEKLS